MKDIKISIIVPVYNASKFLERSIKSIITQDFKDIEIICVNDGSIDNSLDILKKFQKEDSRIIVIDKKNGGSSNARNSALKIAKGEYCLNIDSDDWIEQGYLKNIYNRAKKDDLDITISDIIFDYEEDLKRNYILDDLDISDTEIISGEEYIGIFLKENFNGFTWNKLIKREVYLKNNLKYNEDIFMMEDVELVLRLASYCKKVGKLNKAYYHYIQGINNGSGKISIKRLNDIERCFDSIKKSFKDKNNILEKLSCRRVITLCRYLNISYSLKGEVEYQRIQKDMLEEVKKIDFLKFEYGDAKVAIIFCNILKIFPYIKIMNLLFTLDSVIIEKLRKLKSK